MGLTLPEAAKLSQDPLRSAIIEQFARESDLLMAMPFDTIAGNALRYNQEAVLPGVAFRGVNEGYTASTGVVNPVTEALFIAGGDLDVDRFIVRTQGEATRATHTLMKVKALAAEITRAIIKGDSDAEPREFDGLQKRIVGSQLVSNSAGTGAALSLANLDAVIDTVDNPQFLLMNKAMRRRLTAAARTTTVGGYVTYTQDAFGRQVTRYNDLPILAVYGMNGGTDPLQFNEAAAGGGTASTSIYVLSFGDGVFTGIQSGEMEVRDLGEQDATPVFRTRCEWDVGMALYHSRSVARVYGITDAAVVV